MACKLLFLCLYSIIYGKRIYLAGFPLFFMRKLNFERPAYFPAHDPLRERGLLLTEIICSHGEQILSFSQPVLKKRANIFNRIVSLGSVSVPLKELV